MHSACVRTCAHKQLQMVRGVSIQLMYVIKGPRGSTAITSNSFKHSNHARFTPYLSGEMAISITILTLEDLTPNLCKTASLNRKYPKKLEIPHRIPVSARHSQVVLTECTSFTRIILALVGPDRAKPTFCFSE